MVNQKLAEKAVDGVTINDIDSCTILDNYYDDEPQLTIDLGTRQDVSGVTVFTWQGQQDGELYTNDNLLFETRINYVKVIQR